MAVADRWEGMPADSCACGKAMIWSLVNGFWVVIHQDSDDAVLCAVESGRFPGIRLVG